MKQPIRLALLLSATVLFTAACAPVPFEDQATYGITGNSSTYTPSYSAPAPASVASAPVSVSPVVNRPASIPEASPLSMVAANNNVAATTPTASALPQAHSHNHQTHTHTASNVPAAGPAPVGTVPQVPAATNYTPPAATNNNTYDTYAVNTNSSGGNTTYDYSGTNGGSTSYNNTAAGTNNYAANTSASTPNYAANTSASNNYYAGGNNTSYDSYTNSGNTGGSSNYYANASSNTAAAGGAAVQVFATVSQAKAERIRQDINSQGLQAIVDQVDGLYKVRVPYPNETQARANLIRVRSVSGTPGAFVTMR